MSFTSERLGGIKDKAEEQVKGHLELFKLKLVENASLTLGFAYTLVFLVVLMVLGFFFLSIAASFFLNEYFDSRYLGFLLLGGGYVLVSTVFIVTCVLRRQPLFTGFFVSVFSKILNIRK